jgi:hypothetical protein
MLGEKNFDLYYGARDLYYTVDGINDDVVFEEKLINDRYFTDLIQNDFNELESFFFKKIPQSLSCPQSELSSMYSYLRFSNRVLALSYLYENIQARKEIAKRMGQSNVCQVDWQSTLESCTPKSRDMKFFVKSAKHLSKNRKNVLASSSFSMKDKQSEWLKHLRSGDYEDESQFRLKEECRNSSCSRIQFEGAMERVNTTCSVDQKMFVNICSESDRIYGLGYISESYSLLVNSDILEVADESGYARGCLRRFKQITTSKEEVYSNLELIFPITYSNMVKNKRRYLQGELFPAGSMKKFIDMGLVDLFTPKPVAQTIVKKNKTPVVNKAKPLEDKIEFVDRFIKKKTKRVSRQKKVAKAEIDKKEKVSAFQEAVFSQVQSGYKSVEVNMLKFKYDFLFSLNLKKLLEENLKIYISREGLLEMKKRDHLGSPKGPMPLLFLKYLIESNNHQALYNMISILGNEFYVTNDVDKVKTKAYNYIKLLNDETTDNQWQLLVLEPPAKKK